MIDSSRMREWNSINVTNLSTLLIAEWNTLGNVRGVTLSYDENRIFLADDSNRQL